jgi:hypothetical protein
MVAEAVNRIDSLRIEITDALPREGLGQRGERRGATYSGTASTKPRGLNMCAVFILCV